MEVSVKVIQINPTQSGVSKSGNSWTKTEFIGETFEQYPKKISFNIFNNKTYIPQQGSAVCVSFDISSREWVDKSGVSHWSTDVTVTGLTPYNASQQVQAPQQQPQAPEQQQMQDYDAQAEVFFKSQEPTGNLPF